MRWYRFQINWDYKKITEQDTAVLATGSDPAIASQKLQTNLAAIRNCLNKSKVKVNGSNSVHIIFTRNVYPRSI
jgi:hypothetical protein